MKRKSGSRFIRVTLICLCIYSVGMFGLMAMLSGTDVHAVAADNFDKTSVDNTPEFILTNKSNGCRYIYDSVKKTSHIEMGYDNCEPLSR